MCSGIFCIANSFFDALMDLLDAWPLKLTNRSLLDHKRKNGVFDVNIKNLGVVHKQSHERRNLEIKAWLKGGFSSFRVRIDSDC